MVGQRTLDPLIEVRILGPEPILWWPLRLAAQDVALSRRKQGFDSPRGYHPRIPAEIQGLKRLTPRFRSSREKGGWA